MKALAFATPRQAACAAALLLGITTVCQAAWPDLGDALDRPDLEWQAQGWFPGSWLTHDGSDAANSEYVWSGGSFIETMAQGPALIQFWWIFQFCSSDRLTLRLEVDSRTEAVYDCLAEEDWQQVSTELPPGLHRLRWVMSGAIVLAEFPFAAVDEVVLQTVLPPSIAQQPEPQVVVTGRSATFAVQASGLRLRYQWYKDTVLIPNATNATHTIAQAQPADAGRYHVVVSNTAGALTSRDVGLTVGPCFLGLGLSNNLLRASLAGLPETGSIVIQSSADLSDWTPIQTNPSTPAGLLLTLPVDRDLPRQFFRAVTLATE